MMYSWNLYLFMLLTLKVGLDSTQKQPTEVMKTAAKVCFKHSATFKWKVK